MSITIDKVDVFDVSGRLISSINAFTTSGIKTINLLGLTKGVYFINLYDSNRMTTKKMIIE